jgi:ElaB/YqjD/DUF883 family membrane-anchored ribosome-binding protein
MAASTATKKTTRARASEDLADRMAEAAHETIDDLGERAQRAEEELARRAREGGQSLTQRAGGIVQRVTHYIEEHPFMAVTVAFGVGILATTLLRNSGINLAQYFAPDDTAPEDDLAD